MTAVFRRLTAICEIIAILIIGVFAVRFALPLLPESLTGGAWPDAQSSALPLAASDAATIALRFSVLIAVGFTWLWFCFRQSPRDAGVSTGGKSPAQLLLAGLAVSALAALPWKGVVLWNKYAQAGEGLHAWDQINQAGLRPDVIVLVLATAMLLPPVLEEIFARGFVRTRLQLVFGPACAVLVAALIFALSHGHFHSEDPVVRMLGASSFFAAIVFGWSVVRTGSVLPAMLGHAILNAPEPNDIMAMTIFVAVLALIALVSAPAIFRAIGAFAVAVARERWVHLIWSLPAVAAVFLVGFQQQIVLLGVAAAGIVFAIIEAIFLRKSAKT